MRVSGGSVCQASITLANSSVIVPLPVSGGYRCANRFSRGPFPSWFRGVGSGLQIRHPGFESRRRLLRKSLPDSDFRFFVRGR